MKYLLVSLLFIGGIANAEIKTDLKVGDCFSLSEFGLKNKNKFVYKITDVGKDQVLFSYNHGASQDEERIDIIKLTMFKVSCE